MNTGSLLIIDRPPMLVKPSTGPEVCQGDAKCQEAPACRPRSMLAGDRAQTIR
jgi:hypothetical protein